MEDNYKVSKEQLWAEYYKAIEKDKVIMDRLATDTAYRDFIDEIFKMIAG